MNIYGQRILFKDKAINLLFKLPLLIFLLLAHTCSAIASPADVLHKATPDEISRSETKSINNIKAHKKHVLIVISPKNNLHTSISKSLEDALKQTNPDFVIIKTTPEEKIIAIDNNNDLVVSIGDENRVKTNKNYPDSNKLFLTSNTQKNSFNTNSDNAILYMTQPYCRQLEFIHAINKNWNTVSILSSKEKNINEDELDRCANQFNLTLHLIKTIKNSSISRNMKDALGHSDILLALPDKNIYNSKTVKNILLTSYRFRKPVIAFSGNFVKAGALASIHSNPDQIAKSASNIISDYFKFNHKFKSANNFPQLFDVSLNLQVFKALALPAPNINKIKHNLTNTGYKEPGLSK